MESLIDALQPTEVVTRALMLDDGPTDITVVRRRFRPWIAEWPAMSRERRAEIVGLLVERASATRQTGMTGLEWTAPAAPFFRRAVLSERAVWDSNPRHED